MVRGARKFLALGVAAAVVYSIKEQLNFVLGPRHAGPVAAAAASMMMAPAAFANEIGDASKKLGDASYNFAKEVDWNNGIFLQAPGKFQPLKALKAIDKMIEMGAAADPKLLKVAAEAHHKAIGSISGPNGVTSRADWDAVKADLGRVVASVPKAKVTAVYDAVMDITAPKCHPALSCSRATMSREVECFRVMTGLGSSASSIPSLRKRSCVPGPAQSGKVPP
ncbi:unnamed protein product [Symbiodinium sp. KB8]|nr:unnamed protein product [Symbiodinium sp. KB8]